MMNCNSGLAILMGLTLVACSQPERVYEPSTHESLNAGLWTQTAAEYAASTQQAYNTARESLDLALAYSTWTAALEQQGEFSGLAPVVLLDIDQTVLDNSGYNSQLILAGEQHSLEHFRTWCEFHAPPVPGAKAFLDYAVSRGVTVIYYSARPESLRECTRSNLLAAGLPLASEDFLLLSDGTTATRKARQRRELVSRYRILLIIGDNLDDFVAGSRSGPENRRAMAQQYASRWGREWIILPNPLYGHWESSIYDFNRELTREERIDRKLRHLSE